METIQLLQAKNEEHILSHRLQAVEAGGTEDSVEIQLQAVTHVLRDKLQAVSAMCQSIIDTPTTMEKQSDILSLLVGATAVVQISRREKLFAWRALIC